MILDPKKNYPPVRVRLVDYKTKAMVDLSIPSEYFSEGEITQFKESLKHWVAKGDLVANDIATIKVDAENADIEKAMFSEEEKDGEE